VNNVRAADIHNIIEERRRRLPPGGDGGHDGGMPPELPERVAVLEAHVGHIRDDVAGLRSDAREIRGDVTALKVDVATIKENIRHLPTKGWAVATLLMTLAAIVGLTTFAPKIQAWLGITH
jgi:hypothetical protein